MAKKATRIEMWKIVASLVGCAVVSPALFVLASFAERHSPVPDDPTRSSQAVFTLPTFITIVGVGVGLLGILALIWLLYRIYNARIPTWKKNLDRFGQPKR